MKRLGSPREYVQAVLTSAQKCRSNWSENGERETATELFPGLYSSDWDNVLTVAARMLDSDRPPSGGDAANLAHLVHRSKTLRMALDIAPVAQGIEPLPSPLECWRRWGVD